MCADKSEPVPRARTARIDQHNDGQRIDNYLMSLLKGVPRSHIYQLLRSGQVRVNKGRIKPQYKLQAGDEVRIPPVRLDSQAIGSVPGMVQQQLIEAILHEDDNILVINKPAGLPVHAGSGLRYGVIEAFKQLRPGQFIELVHRLDRDTSGCLLLAKNRDTLTRLHTMLRDLHGIEKHYLALVAGHWPGLNRVDFALEKILRSGEHMIEATPTGTHALSHFEARRLYHDASLMSVQIETGRTHQIRVHAAHSGHPLAGDTKYGDATFNQHMKSLGLKRLFLHASHLVIKLDRTLRFEAPLPEDLATLLTRLEA